MRRFAFTFSCLLVWLSMGCTSSDRDYVRNHIVLVDHDKAPRSAIPAPQTVHSAASASEEAALPTDGGSI
jgi:hypothetical protein